MAIVLLAALGPAHAADTDDSVLRLQVIYLNYALHWPPDDTYNADLASGPLGAVGGLAAFAQDPAPEDESTIELSMFLRKLDVLHDDDGYPQPQESGCIHLRRGITNDAGCGPLTITTDEVMGTTRVVGEIASEEFEYIPDPYSFTEIGPSTITIDLTFIGEGVIIPGYGATLRPCGIVRPLGASATAHPGLRRATTGAGLFSSAAIGPVDIADFEPWMYQGVYLSGTACE